MHLVVVGAGRSVAQGSRRVRAVLQLLVLGVALACTVAQSAHAQDHSTLVRLMQESASFRVRARAAFALGTMADASASGALQQALHDSHPLVRAAAARALGNVGSRASVSALRGAANDSTPEVAEQAKLALREIAAREAISHAMPQEPVTPVRTTERASLAGARYVLVVGEMRQPNAASEGDLTPMLSAQIAAALRELPKVAVFSLAQMTETVADEIVRRRLPAFRLDGNLTRAAVTRTPDALDMRCELSLLLMDEPDRTLRSMLRGAASANEQPRGPRSLQQPKLTEKTLRGAVHSALANIEEALVAAAAHHEVGVASLEQGNKPARSGRRR